MWVYNLEEEVDVNGKSVYGEKETLGRVGRIGRMGWMGMGGRIGWAGKLSDSLIDPDC